MDEDDADQPEHELGDVSGHERGRDAAVEERKRVGISGREVVGAGGLVRTRCDLPRPLVVDEAVERGHVEEDGRRAVLDEEGHPEKGGGGEDDAKRQHARYRRAWPFSKTVLPWRVGAAP